MTSYVWVHHVPLGEFPETPYEKVMAAAVAHWDKAAGQFGLPYYPNVTMGWDSSPRTVQSDRFINHRHPFMATMSGNTPEAFRTALTKAKTWLERRPPADRILTINAWNELTEGSYLEPDTVNGMGYLESIKGVFGQTAKAQRCVPTGASAPQVGPTRLRQRASPRRAPSSARHAAGTPESLPDDALSR